MTSTVNPLSELAAQCHAMVVGLDIEPCYKRFHTTPQHDGSPHIEFSGDGFDSVVTERGAEFQRRSGLTADEVLHGLLEGMTSRMATEYELRHRVAGLDGRRVWFPYQEQLMARLQPDWGVRLASRHQQILRDHPFDP